MPPFSNQRFLTPLGQSRFDEIRRAREDRREQERALRIRQVQEETAFLREQQERALRIRAEVIRRETPQTDPWLSAWEETDQAADFPIPDVAQRPQTVQVEFEEEDYGTRCVTRPPGYWRLRNGKFIAIREMTNTHLTNTINMLERTAHSRGRRISRTTGSYSELLSEQQRRRTLEADRQRVEQFLIHQPPGAAGLLGAMVGGTMGQTAPRPDGIQDPQAWEIRYVQNSAQVRQPEPEPSPSAIEENRPKRRIKT